MLFENANLTDLIPEHQQDVSDKNSSQREKTFQQSSQSTSIHQFFHDKQKKNSPRILKNSTASDKSRRNFKKFNDENWRILDIKRTLRPRSTDMEIDVLVQRDQNSQVVSSMDLQSSRSGSGIRIKTTKIQKKDLTSTLVEYFSQIVTNRNKPVYGLSVKLLVQLYVARCQDLQVRISTQQLLKFAEIFEHANDQRTHRILNLSDMSLGDQSMKVVCKIIDSSKEAYCRLDLSKNQFKDEGIKELSQMLVRNTSILHLNISDNSITAEGATMLFQSLNNNQYITSIEMANRDCQKSRVRIGKPGAFAMGQMLQQPYCLISHLDLTGNTLPPEALGYVIEGVNACRSLVSLNLTSNSLGLNPGGLAGLLSILDSNHSLVDLNLENNSIQDRFLEEMAAVLQERKNLPLQKLDLSQNKFSIKGAAYLLQGINNIGGASVKMVSLILDKNDFRFENQNPLNTNFICSFNRALMQNLKIGKLKTISLASCSLSQLTVRAIGEGLKSNSFLESLNLRDNMIPLQALQPMMESLKANPNIPLKLLDLSCNQLDDKSGELFYNSLKKLKSLEMLNLRDNKLENESAKHLIKLVSENSSIYKIVINYNLIDAAVVNEIEDLCKKNQSNRIYKDMPQIKMEIKRFKKIQDDFRKIDELSAHLVLGKQEKEKELGNIHLIEDKIDDLKKDQESQNLTLKKEMLGNQLKLKAMDEMIKALDKVAAEKKQEQDRIIKIRQNMCDLQAQKTQNVQAQLDREQSFMEKSQYIQKIISERQKFQRQLQQTREINKSIDQKNQAYKDEISQIKEEINVLLRNDLQKLRNKVLVHDYSPKKSPVKSRHHSPVKHYIMGVGGSPAKRKNMLFKSQSKSRKINQDLKLKIKPIK